MGEGVGGKDPRPLIAPAVVDCRVVEWLEGGQQLGIQFVVELGGQPPGPDAPAEKVEAEVEIPRVGVVEVEER